MSKRVKAQLYPDNTEIDVVTYELLQSYLFMVVQYTTGKISQYEGEGEKIKKSDLILLNKFYWSSDYSDSKIY